MIYPQELGRFEYISGNSDKFWIIKYLKPNEYEVMWGKNGFPAQNTMIINQEKARLKIKEKIAKGYHHVTTDIDDFHYQCWVKNNKKHLESILSEKNEPPQHKIKI